MESQFRVWTKRLTVRLEHRNNNIIMEMKLQMQLSLHMMGMLINTGITMRTKIKTQHTTPTTQKLQIAKNPNNKRTETLDILVIARILLPKAIYKMMMMIWMIKFNFEM